MATKFAKGVIGAGKTTLATVASSALCVTGAVVGSTLVGIMAGTEEAANVAVDSCTRIAEKIGRGITGNVAKQICEKPKNFKYAPTPPAKKTEEQVDEQKVDKGYKSGS
jgi:hypothetical protein